MFSYEEYDAYEFDERPSDERLSCGHVSEYHATEAELDADACSDCIRVGLGKRKPVMAAAAIGIEEAA